MIAIAKQYGQLTLCSMTASLSDRNSFSIAAITQGLYVLVLNVKHIVLPIVLYSYHPGRNLVKNNKAISIY